MTTRSRSQLQQRLDNLNELGNLRTELQRRGTNTLLERLNFNQRLTKKFDEQMKTQITSMDKIQTQLGSLKPSVVVPPSSSSVATGDFRDKVSKPEVSVSRPKVDETTSPLQLEETTIPKGWKSNVNFYIKEIDGDDYYYGLSHRENRYFKYQPKIDRS